MSVKQRTRQERRDNPWTPSQNRRTIVVMEVHSGIATATLRLLAPTDLDNVYALLSDWEVVRHMCLALHSKEDSAKFIRDAIDEPAASPWRSIVRAIVDDNSALAGLCGIVILAGAEEGEIWYLIKPEFWGRGLATGATAALIDFGFTGLGLHRVWASCLPGNPASARVLEKVGMRREGLRKRNLKIHGEWKDSLLYAILAEEWQSGHPIAF